MEKEKKKCYVIQASFGWPYDDVSYDKIIAVFLSKEKAEEKRKELTKYYDDESELALDANEIYSEVLSDYFDDPDVDEAEYNRRENEDFNENFVLNKILENLDNLEKDYQEKYNTVEKMRTIAKAIVDKSETAFYGPCCVYPVIEADLFE